MPPVFSKFSTLHFLIQNKSITLTTVTIAALFTYLLNQSNNQPSNNQLVNHIKNDTINQTTKQSTEKSKEQSTEQSKDAPTKESPKQSKESSANASGNQRVKIDAKFWQNLMKLIRIAIPALQSKEQANSPSTKNQPSKYRELLYLVMLGAVLSFRTYLSIKITSINGMIVQSIVNREFLSFVVTLGQLLSLSIPSSMVNSLLKYLRGMLALSFRERLVNHFQSHYMHGNNFYAVLNLDARISNPDAALTTTIDAWSVSLAQLYSDVTKPLLDIVLYAYKISDVIGPLGPSAVVGYYAVCGVLIQALSPKFGKLTAETQRLEGSFRSAHHRLMASAEEIAFYDGAKREHQILDGKFNAVMSHASEFFRLHLAFGAFDGFLTKYGAVLLGYSVLGLPVFGPKSQEYAASVAANPAQITRDYVRNSGLLINFSQAIGRIVTSYKELQRLAGFTQLVTELDTVLTDLDEGRYERTMLTETTGQVIRSGLAPGAGVIAVDETRIAFDDVPIITPNGDLLVDHVTFSVKRGENLMIIGPNGCGKSSLFRILGGLWPVWGGRVSRPSKQHLFYVPQRPFLTSGTLRDQLVYPDTPEQMAANGVTDDVLEDLLRRVRLENLLARPGGLDAEEEWADVLSGGEKQRVAMARLFYHRPYFAILDECTSAVSVDVEGLLYSHSKELDITLITISHRQTLWQYHDLMLRFEDVEAGNKGRSKRVVKLLPMQHEQPQAPSSRSNSVSENTTTTKIA